MIHIISKTKIEPDEKLGVIDVIARYKCVVSDNNEYEDTYEVVLSEEHLELVETLNKLAIQLKIYPAMMDELWKKICNFSDAQYKLGLKDCNKA